MKTRIFDTVEERTRRFSHAFVIEVADIAAAATGKTLTLITDLPAKSYVRDSAFVLNTPFDGGAATNLSLKVGYNGATFDDPVAFINTVEIHHDATYVPAGRGTAAGVDQSTIDSTYGSQEAAVLTSLRNIVNPLNGGVLKEKANIEAVFTATGANLSTLTSGEVTVLLDIVRLDKID